MAKRCPFRDPEFEIDVDEPCPVCGMLGTWPAEDKCVDNTDAPPLPRADRAGGDA